MAKITVQFSYGRKKVSIKIPGGCAVQTLEIGSSSPISEPSAVVKNAIQNPVGTSPLSELVRPHYKVALLIPDRTRVFPTQIVLPLLLDELEKAGVPKQNITIVIALGTHRDMSKAEIIRSVGKDICHTFRVINHNWRSELISLGKTPNGTPISVNRLVYESDIKIGLGSVKPHRVTGWSGGGKIIQPGVCGNDTTGHTHWMSAQYQGEDIIGAVENPVRAEIEVVARQVGLDFVVNVVLDRKHRIYAVYCGDFVQAHRWCVKAANELHSVTIDRKADIVICGSSPQAANLWAAMGGVYQSELLVKEGGTIVLLAACPEGVARKHPEVLKFGYLPYQEVRHLVEEGEIKDLSAAAHMVHGGEPLFRKRANCILVSEGISKEDAHKLHLQYASTPQEAVNKAIDRQGRNATIFTLSGETDAFVLPQ